MTKCEFLSNEISLKLKEGRMTNKKITHYNMDVIDAENATINIIFGERSNGKSYQVKHKKGVIKSHLFYI